jgi:hypothetical protein
VGRQTGPVGIGVDLREKRRQMLGHHLIEHRPFGLAPLVARRLDFRMGLHTRRGYGSGNGDTDSPDHAGKSSPKHRDRELPPPSCESRIAQARIGTERKPEKSLPRAKSSPGARLRFAGAHVCAGLAESASSTEEAGGPVRWLPGGPLPDRLYSVMISLTASRWTS